MATYVDVIDDAREETDQVGSDQGGDDTALIRFLQRAYPRLRRRLSKVAPDWFTIQAEGTLTDTPTNSVDKWSQLRRVQLQVGDRWVTVPPADPNFIWDPERLCYRVIGGNLEILPESVSTGTFRVEYIPDATLPGADNHLDLPPGAEDLLVQLLCRRIRRKLDQSEQPHIEEYKRIWEEVVASLLPEETTPRSVSDYNDDLDGGW